MSLSCALLVRFRALNEAPLPGAAPRVAAAGQDEDDAPLSPSRLVRCMEEPFTPNTPMSLPPDPFTPSSPQLLPSPDGGPPC